MAKKQSKRYRKAIELKEEGKQYGLTESIELLGQMPKVKFDETVELSFKLGVDARQSDQMVRGTINLPNGSGKDVRVLVFTEDAEKAKAAGADYAGLEDLIKKVEGGWMDFDVAVSTPSAMKLVRSVARVLGPRGLMPNPKSGTVTDDIEEGIKAVKAGRVEYKMDKTSNLAVVVGKRSFTSEALEQNVKEALESVKKARPEACKGEFIKSATLSASMSPSIKLDMKAVNLI